MAELRDEHGNPIQMTDELGNPVQLTDERGNPVHLKGVAATSTTTTPTDTGGFAAYNPGLATSTDTHGGITTGPHASAAHGGVTMADVIGSREHEQDKQGGEGEKGYVLGRSSSSSSSSSEDDGQGGRRKKSLKQKIKEKLTGGKHKEDHPQAEQGPGHGITSTASTTTTTTAATPTAGEHHEHEKKSMMEKIKEKLPGHHNH